MTEAHHLCACGHLYDEHHEGTCRTSVASSNEPCTAGRTVTDCPCPGFTLAATPLPDGCAPDPLDQVARKVCISGFPEDDCHVVWLSDAKRIRDKAVAEAFGQGQRHGYDAAQAEAWACVHVWLGGPPPEGTSLADAIRLTIDSALASATGEGPC